MPSRRLIAALSLLMVALPLSAANKGGGTFRKGTNQLTMKHACAYRVPSGKGNVVKVFLTSHPVTCSEFDGIFDPDNAMSRKMREVEGGYVRISVSEDGSERGLYFDTNAPSDSFNVSGSGNFATTVNTESRLEGSWVTDKPEDFFDKTFEFRMNWSVDVLSGAVTGTPLPAGGGDPGKAFLAYVNAVNKKDHKAIRKLMSPGRAEDVYYSEGSDSFDENFKWFRDAEFVSAKVLSGWVNGQTATLKVEGKNGAGEKTAGFVQMKLEDGLWRPGESALSTIFE